MLPEDISPMFAHIFARFPYVFPGFPPWYVSLPEDNTQEIHTFQLAPGARCHTIPFTTRRPGGVRLGNKAKWGPQGEIVVPWWVFMVISLGFHGDFMVILWDFMVISWDFMVILKDCNMITKWWVGNVCGEVGSVVCSLPQAFNSDNFT